MDKDYLAKIKEEVCREINKGENYRLNRKKWLWQEYKMTPEEYNMMSFKQKGRCAICRKHWTWTDRRLVVDHDHKTGKVRGLLCFKCNITLGIIEGKIDILKDMVEYLIIHHPENKK